MIYNNILELIGKTPLVKLQKMNDTDCEIALKLEFFNPSGSIKDRASFYMLNEAQKAGKINENTLIIEPTSGNTGIGLAMCCAVMGLKIIITMPESMSIERRKIIQAYGAELVLTPKELGMQGAVDKALEIAKENPNSFIPSQFSNPANTLAHIETTTKEIWEDTEGKVDVVVAGIGTSGTTMGLCEGLKKMKPSVKIFGIEPSESPLLSEGHAHPHKIQGIGANFVPELYHSDKIDGIIKVNADEAIETAQKLAKNEGILVGISSGAILKAALDLAKKPENKGKLIVAIMCDFGERYLSTELFNE
ncbi:MAG: cysteine synthase A [Candidatus Gastranaerophilales bacterium]|nr:cysteine synthase A [Candidatus Gastranaerophilales bacterium]